MKKLVFSCLAVACAVVFAPTVGQAQVVVYTTPASYTAASTNNSSYDFQSQTSGGETSPFTVGPLSFSAGGLRVYNDNDYGNGTLYLAAFNSAETITLSGASALAFNLGTFDNTETLAISINGAAAITFTPGTAPNTAFIGFTDTVPITSLTITNSSAGDEIDLTSFQVGAAAVPEPSTWAMLGVGAMGAGVVALRRRRRAA